MDIYVPKELKELAELFDRYGVKLYSVGGMVRNSLLGLEVCDYDVCSIATPEDVAVVLEDSGYGLLEKAPLLGCLEIVCPGGARFEHTTFRKESYALDGSHRPTRIAFSKSLEEDAFRRDFSVNAMYLDVLTGKIIDPCGGREDLSRRVLRATCDNPDVIMKDDGLRTLRLVRFAAELDFGVEEKTYYSARKYARLLADIPKERITAELLKLLMCDEKYPSLHGAYKFNENAILYRALELMVDLNIMGEVFIELLEGEGVIQRSDYHAYDVLHHALHSCAWAAPLPSVRLAALLHDVGKPRSIQEGGHMKGHDKLGAQMAEQMLAGLALPKALVKETLFLVEHHMFDLTGSAKDSTLRKYFLEHGAQKAELLALMREADVHGSGIITGEVDTASKFRNVLEQMKRDGVPFDMRDLNITGEDIIKELGILPGPRVGEIKRALWMHCANKPGDNNPQRLKRLCRNY